MYFYMNAIFLEIIQALKKRKNYNKNGKMAIIFNIIMIIL